MQYDTATGSLIDSRRLGVVKGYIPSSGGHIYLTRHGSLTKTAYTDTGLGDELEV